MEETNFFIERKNKILKVKSKTLSFMTGKCGVKKQ